MAGGNEVGRVSVRVVPNTDGFRKKAESELKAITRDLKVKVDVEPDLTGFRKQIQAAAKGIKANVDVKANTKGARAKIDAATEGHSAEIDVELTGFAATLAKLKTLRAIVNRDMRARVVIDGNMGLAAAYGALKGFKQVKRVLGRIAKVAVIAGLAIAAIGPPIIALGGGAAMAALAAWSTLGSAMSVVATGGIAAGFIKMASRSEAVKSAWSDTKTSIAATFDEVNQPVENSLVALAPKVSEAFQKIQPNIARVSKGVAGLIDYFGEQVPARAHAMGFAMEKAFNAGQPAMKKLISGLPHIVVGLGNMLETIGNSKAMQRIWNGFIDGIPGGLEAVGRGFDKAARGAGKLYDWFKSPALDKFRDGFSDLKDNLDDVDWSRAQKGVEDVMNEFGELAGNTDMQALADDFGKLATGVSKIVDAFDKLGVKGTIALGIVGGIAKGIAAELASAVTKALVGKAMEKLLGGAADLAGTGLDIATGLAGSIAEGLAGSAGEAIGDAIGDLFTGGDKEEIELEITKVIWPDGEPKGDLHVASIIWPDGGGPKGDFSVENILWPDDAEAMTGDFKIGKIIFPGDTEELTGTFKISEIIFPNDETTLSGTFTVTGIVFPGGGLVGLTSFSDILAALLPNVTLFNTEMGSLNMRFIGLSVSSALLAAGMLLLSAPLAAIGLVITPIVAGFTSLAEQFTVLAPQLLLVSTFMAPLALALTTMLAPMLLLPALVTGLGVGFGLLALSLPIVTAAMLPLALAFTMILPPMILLPGLVAGLAMGFTMLAVSAPLVAASLIPMGIGLTMVSTAFLILMGALSPVIGLFSAIAGAVDRAAGRFMALVGTVSNMVGSILGILGGFVSGVIGLIQGAISGMTNIWDGGLIGMIGSTDGHIGTLISLVGTIPGRVMGVLGGLGGLLVSSGRALIEGFVSGIRSMIGAVREAASAVLEAARGFFPFSPAKEGPFSGKGYTTYSGRALTKDFAGGMTDNIGLVGQSAEDVVKAAQKPFKDYNEGLILTPVLDANAKKIADFRKKEAEDIAKGTHDATKAHENYRKMLESLDTPDYREMNLSFQSYYIDGAKGILQKQIDSMDLPGQMRGSVKGAVSEARKHFGDHPFLASIEANVDSEHFSVAMNKVIEESKLAAVPIEFAISNLDQLKSDLGFGDGVISRGLDAAMAFDPNNSDANRYKDEAKTEVHYHVTDMQEAMRLEEERRRRGALRYI